MCSLEQFAHEDAVLLMDNYSSHVGQVSLDLLWDARVRVITWSPDTTHIFQELDISLFGFLKRRGQSKFPFDHETDTATFLCTTYRTFKQTMVEVNIWAAFQQAGFELNVSIEPYCLRLDEEKSTASLSFQEISSLDFPLERRSARQQQASFGWINKPE
jgi:hypothetical protein